MGARHALDPHRPREVAGPDLVTERVDDGRRRPDEDESRVLDRARERRPFRQEPVSRMDRLDPVGEGRLDDRLDPEVALGRRRWTDADGDVGLLDVQGAGIGVAVDGDRFHAHLVAGADDPDGDLAAVGDQDSTERGRRRGHRRAASLRKDIGSRLASERDVAMLLSRVRVALVGQHVERPDEPRARLGRSDDVVDVARARPR